MPIARLIITEAAIRIGKAFARLAAVMIGTFPLLRQPARIEVQVKRRPPEAALQFQQGRRDGVRRMPGLRRLAA